MDAVVDREAVADVLQNRSAGGARDQPKPRDDQAFEEHLHQEHLLLEQVELVQEHPSELIEVGVSLGGPADLPEELEPRLHVARLVLHHRRVVEPGLVMGRRVQKLRRHLHGQDVRLVLLGDDGTPDVGPAGLLLRGAARFRDRGDVAPRDVGGLPLGALGELVVADDAGAPLRGVIRVGLDTKRLDAHARGA